MTVTRRSVLVAATATPAAGALLSTAAAPTALAADAPAGAGGRHTVPLRDGWRFALVNPGGITDPTGAYDRAADPGYDDSAWREVAVPHDWSIEQTPTTDHGTTSGTGFLPGGLGWYRVAFTLPPAYAGKRVSVELAAREATRTPAAGFGPDHPAPANYPRADASYSGREDTPPVAMLDGDPATGWSNAFVKPATALLPAFSGARATDWVCLDAGRTRTFDRVAVSFTLDAGHTLPARAEVAVWDGRAYAPVTGARTDWATASDSPTVITFDAVRGSRLRLTLTSAYPGQAKGAVRISRLEV